MTNRLELKENDGKFAWNGRLETMDAMIRSSKLNIYKLRGFWGC